MGILQGRQMISRGIPSLTLIGASVNSPDSSGLTDVFDWIQDNGQASKKRQCLRQPAAADTYCHAEKGTHAGPTGSARVSVLLPDCEHRLCFRILGPHATLTESVSDSLGRNMETREQKVVLMLGCCIPTTPPPLLVSVH